MKYLFILFFSLASFQSYTQVSEPDSSISSSPQAIINEVMNIISGDTTEVRDWEHFRSLFIPTAQFVIKNHGSQRRPMSVLTLEEFIRSIGPSYQQNGFLEKQLDVKIDEYNGIAQVFQVYYCKTLNGTFEASGVNSYQLIYFDGRWWIANLMWSSNSNGAELPEF